VRRISDGAAFMIVARADWLEVELTKSATMRTSQKRRMPLRVAL